MLELAPTTKDFNFDTGRTCVILVIWVRIPVRCVSPYRASHGLPLDIAGREWFT